MVISGYRARLFPDSRLSFFPTHAFPFSRLTPSFFLTHAGLFPDSRRPFSRLTLFLSPDSRRFRPTHAPDSRRHRVDARPRELLHQIPSSRWISKEELWPLLPCACGHFTEGRNLASAPQPRYRSLGSHYCLTKGSNVLWVAYSSL